MSVAPLELVRGPGAADLSGGEPAASATGARMRVVDGALSCIARQGVAKTTLDDVARAARYSRATVYRVFPGGKDAVLGAVVDTEVSSFFSALALRMGAATDVEDVLVAGMTEAATRVTEHRALRYLLEHEPELVLSQLAFARMDQVLAVTCAFTTPFLGRWLDQAEARRVAEWAARIVVSYLLCPADGVDLTDARQVRRLVRLFVLPGVHALRVPEGAVRSAPVAGGPVRRADRSLQSSRARLTTKGEAS
ncbi:MAG TPA: helix-turn-helix domain-containing protein [Acidimicrobiales bacterium]|nr:helix-turn-helix domain-containing protein [Acidimicrobiales bacterium]